jgi:hypothetical protein
VTTRPVIAVIAAVAVAAAVIIPISSAPAASSRTFTLQSKLDRSTLHRIDSGKHGNSAGDEFVLATSLSRGGSPAGRALYVQTAVDDRYRGLSQVVQLMLPEGTLELQGAGLDRRAPGLAKPPVEWDYAIVGGTGAYTGASGIVHPVDTKSGQDLEVKLAG